MNIYKVEWSAYSLEKFEHFEFLKPNNLLLLSEIYFVNILQNVLK